jgi:hypothetical protein
VTFSTLPLRALRLGSNRCVTANAAWYGTAIIWAASSGVVSSVCFHAPAPALLINKSTPSCSAKTLTSAGRSAAKSDTSTGRTTLFVLPFPAVSTSFATATSAVSVRATRMILAAPRRADSIANAFPRPLDAPVTRTVLPSSRRGLVVSASIA